MVSATPIFHSKKIVMRSDKKKPNRDNKKPAASSSPFEKFFIKKSKEETPEQEPPVKKRRTSEGGESKFGKEKRYADNKKPAFLKRDKDFTRSRNSEERKPAESKRPSTGRLFDKNFFDRSPETTRPPQDQENRDSRKLREPSTFREEVKKEIIRLNKFVAQSGICSRRKAAELVKAGEIRVNGNVETNPAYETQESDVITYKGEVLKKEEKLIYLLLNKPKNFITTAEDEKGRKTVMDLVKDKYEERLYPVGRLDRNTTGLLLLTNDGALAKKLSHPSHQIKKIYQAELDKNIKLTDIEKIKDGIMLEDGLAEVDAVDYIEGGKKNQVGIEIHSGKNRIVRRIFESLGYEVVKLDRTYYAGLTKKDLPRGFSRELTEREIIMLRHFTNRRRET